jgi:GNAT superfamily N-acetyltransferase
LTAFQLRKEVAEDLGFIRHLFIANRWIAFSALAMDEQARLKLLSSQFDLQDLHYRTYFPATDRRIVLSGGRPVGRIYLLRGEPFWTLIDLSLLPDALGLGIGSRLIDGMIAEAEAARKPITLHCDVTNPAFEIYKAKGFREVRQEDANWVMEWWPSGKVS